MKKVSTLFYFSFFALSLCAQWSNTTNQFYDSLHMPVCTETAIQNNSIVVKSYPDGGYFIIWEDHRTTGNNVDIYAQKYDANGVALWTENGVPVATGIGWEQMVAASNADYRNYSHADTDSANGFFIAYTETAQLGSYNRAGVAVQHLDASGNGMYPGAGLVIRQPLISGNDDFGMAQLVADGQNGFYVSFATYTSGYANHVTVEGYKVIGSNLSMYVSQKMNEDVYQTSAIGPCGFNQLSLEYRLPGLYDYCLWADGQGGCNVIMNMSASDGEINSRASQKMLAFNALKRIKKACTTTVTRRTSDIANVETIITNYPKDAVVRLYSLQTFTWGYSCSAATYTNYQLENFGLGYQIIATGFYDAYFTKGVTATTPGNINIIGVAASERQYINNQLTPFSTKIYTWADEIMIAFHIKELPVPSFTGRIT